MKEDFTRIRLYLLGIVEKIKNGDYPHDRRDWGGADVAITSKAPKRSAGGFYPDPRYVVTPFSRELSWLFEEMRDTFKELLDACNKTEFYGRMANMAAHYQRKLEGKNKNEKDLLLAVLYEVFSMLEEMGKGKFKSLPVALGKTIFDDLIDRAEACGYLGMEKTRKFFEDMERRFRDS